MKNQTNDYFKIVESQVNYYCRKYFIYDSQRIQDVRQRASEIFLLADKKYCKARKADFKTYLYHELKRLNYFCKKLYQENLKLLALHDILEECFSYTPIDITILYDCINTELTPVARDILIKILSGHFINVRSKGKSLISKTKIMKEFNIGYARFQEYFIEIQNWWRNYNLIGA